MQNNSHVVLGGNATRDNPILRVSRSRLMLYDWLKLGELYRRSRKAAPVKKLIERVASTWSVVAMRSESYL